MTPSPTKMMNNFQLHLTNNVESESQWEEGSQLQKLPSGSIQDLPSLKPLGAQVGACFIPVHLPQSHQAEPSWKHQSLRYNRRQAPNEKGYVEHLERSRNCLGCGVDLNEAYISKHYIQCNDLSILVNRLREVKNRIHVFSVKI